MGTLDANWIRFIEQTPQVCQHFVSLEGEGKAIGEPSLYLRLAYCSARCHFCDTKFSWALNENHSKIFDEELSKEILKNIDDRNIRRVTITGGEPLASAKHFYDIVKYLKKSIVLSLKHLGIESNGLHLASINNTMTILEMFNKINRDFRVKVSLTISPKIQQDVSWYHTSMTQHDLNNAYKDAFTFGETYLRPTHDINYKFVYDFTDEVLQFENILYFIDFLRKDLQVAPRKILLMPLTPDDPHGKDKEFWEESKLKTSHKALELGIRYSPRLHVDLGLD